jgi:hypothetical protein
MVSRQKVEENSLEMGIVVTKLRLVRSPLGHELSLDPVLTLKMKALVDQLVPTPPNCPKLTKTTAMTMPTAVSPMEMYIDCR